MRILVINGSPKGPMSVTLQYVAFIQKKRPDIVWEIVHAGKDIRRMERDGGAFDRVLRAVKAADGILWSSGVYMELVPYQLKRFIELIFERGAAKAFAGKYAASLTTSARWLDNLAHNYLQAVSDDLGMRYCGFHSAEAEDLEQEGERARLLLFADGFIDAAARRRPYVRRYPAVVRRPFTYEPGKPLNRIGAKGKRILVLTDCRAGETNLRRMIDRFKDSFADPVEEINLRDIRIAGGCTACFRCAYDNRCMYEGADEYNAVLTRRILPADVLIWAGSVADRYLSSRWKLFLDRNFVYGHIPIYRGKQLGVIVSGPLSQVPTLREPLEQGQDWHRSNLVDFVSDECGDSETLDALLSQLAADCVRCAESGYIRTPTFAYVGVSKLIRDELWRYQRAIMKADDRYYASHGLYDFPRMPLKYRILGTLYGMRWFRNFLHRQRKLDAILIEPHQQIVRQCGKEPPCR